jgi:hypothetical protein
MLAGLWLPVVLSAVALFFASFLSWMVVRLHKNDWSKLPDEDAFRNTVRPLALRPGNYMFPYAGGGEEMQSAAFQQKLQEGPNGMMTIFSNVGMGAKLGMTFLYFLIVSFCLAYLGTMGVPPGTRFLDVFRFFATAGILTFLSAMVPHRIWFDCRITGHVIESVAYALIVGVLFAAFWPGVPGQS